MDKTSTLGAMLALTIFAASGLASAADNDPERQPDTDAHAHHHRFDAVMHAQRNLDRLAEKLNLKPEQQSAWQTYADNTLARAKERAARVEERRSHRGEARAQIDTATKLDKMSQAMRDRANRLQQTAQDTRAFEQALTPDQKTIFDLYWKAQRHQGMMHPRPA